MSQGHTKQTKGNDMKRVIKELMALGMTEQEARKLHADYMAASPEEKAEAKREAGEFLSDRKGTI